MQSRVAARIEDRQQNEAQCTSNSEENGHNGAEFVQKAPISRQLAGMPQPPFAKKGQVEKDNSYYATSDKERLQTLCSNVRNVPINQIVQSQ